MMSKILTNSGLLLDLVKPEQSQICIEDIAKALSKLCRFAGNTNGFYSVAQHCCYVSELVPEAFKLSALMHDSAEAYISDIPTPFKRLIPEIGKIEDRIMDQIQLKFKLWHVHSDEVKKADKEMLSIEFRDLMGKDPVELGYKTPIESVKITPWSSEFAEQKFLKIFHDCKIVSSYVRALAGYLI